MAVHPNGTGAALGELCPWSGAHILHLYRNDIERRHVLLDFIATGLARGERICVVHDRSIRDCLPVLDAADEPPAPDPCVSPCPAPGPAPAAAPGQIVAETSRRFYLTEGVFDHDRIYRKWREFYRLSKEAGFPACRALGEVLPDLERVANGEAVVLYEMNMERVLQAAPPTCVICQYDSRCFRGDTLLATLCMHPLVLVEGRILPNPFFEVAADLTCH